MVVINIDIILVIQKFLCCLDFITTINYPGSHIGILAVCGSGVDGLESRVISSSSSLSWSDPILIVSSFSFLLIFLARFYFRGAFFAVRNNDFCL